MAVLQSTLKLTLLDQVSARARHINSALDSLHRRTNGMMAMTRNLAAFAVTYMGVTAGIDGTYNAASKMQASLEEVAIKAGLGGQQIEGMKRHLVALSPKVNQTTSDLLSGVDAMVTLGLATDKAMDSIPAIGKAATATGASIADLSGASTSAMQNLGVAPEEVTKMLDMMAHAGNAGAFEMKDMASYFPQLTSAARALGIKGVDGVADLAAALQIARRGAGDASTAANNLANFMDKIMSPDVIKNFKKFGVNVTKELKKAHKDGISPIEHFIKLVDEKTNGGDADLIGQLFGDKQAKDFIRPMLADFKDYIKIREDAERASGTVDEAFVRRMGTNEQKVKSFRIAIANLGESIGANLLTPVADFADKMSGILNTLDQRATVFDRIGASFKGFLNGLGVDGVGDLGKSLEEFIFGVKDGSKAADELGGIFIKFKEFGTTVRGLATDLADNPIVKFLSEMSPYYVSVLKWSLGLLVIASAVRKLASAMYFLSGASAIIGALRTVGGLASLAGSFAGVPGLEGDTDKPGNKTNNGNKTNVPVAGGWLGAMGKWIKGLGVGTMIGAAPMLLDGSSGDFDQDVANQKKFQDFMRNLMGMEPWKPEAIGPKFRPKDPGGYDMAGRAAYASSPAGIAESLVNNELWDRLNRRATTDVLPGKTADDRGFQGSQAIKTISIDAASISAMLQPVGVQQVQVINQAIPNVTVSAPITITGISDPKAAAASAASQLGAQVKAAVESADTD